MRKLSLITLGLTLLFISIFIFTSSSDEDNKSSELTESDINIESITEVSKPVPDTHVEYEENGKECKSLTNTKKRGDCFQTVNSTYLNWHLNESIGYGSDETEVSEGKDLLIYTIEDSDQLGTVQKTDFYDEYLEIRFLDSDSKEGEETIQEYWHFFSNVFPRKYREYLKIITWTEMDYVFSVGRSDNNIRDTVLSISSSPSVKAYRPDSKTILIHEFAHILTLSEDQVPVDEESYDIFVADDKRLVSAQAECPTYFSFGCMEDTSYMHHYYQQFWKDIITDHQTVETVDDFETFYHQYEEHFFNTYMATHPLEDIAEAFTFFVMLHSDELQGQKDIKYDKVDFFYQYEEMVNLRTMILENMYDLSVKDKVFY